MMDVGLDGGVRLAAGTWAGDSDHEYRLPAAAILWRGWADARFLSHRSGWDDQEWALCRDELLEFLNGSWVEELCDAVEQSVTTYRRRLMTMIRQGETGGGDGGEAEAEEEGTEGPETVVEECAGGVAFAIAPGAATTRTLTKKKQPPAGLALVAGRAGRVGDAR